MYDYKIPLRGNGELADFWMNANTMYTCLIFIVDYRLLVFQKYMYRIMIPNRIFLIIFNVKITFVIYSILIATIYNLFTKWAGADIRTLDISFELLKRINFFIKSSIKIIM